MFTLVLLSISITTTTTTTTTKSEKQERRAKQFTHVDRAGGKVEDATIPLNDED
jgi:hypothetical protein